jgi:hypothetical protein
VVLADKSDNLPIASVATVQDASQLFVVLKECVRFIDQKSRPDLFDDTKHRSGRHVVGLERFGHEPLQNGKQCCLSALHFRRRDGQSRRDVPSVVCVAVHNEQCHRDDLVRRQHDMSANSCGYLAQERAPINR